MFLLIYLICLVFNSAGRKILKNLDLFYFIMIYLEYDIKNVYCNDITSYG